MLQGDEKEKWKDIVESITTEIGVCCAPPTQTEIPPRSVTLFPPQFTWYPVYRTGQKPSLWPWWW